MPDVGTSVDPIISLNPFSLFNSQCLLEGMRPTPEQCLLGARSGLSRPTLLEGETVPNHIMRINKISVDAETLNQIFRPLLKEQGSVWQNYKLINTQWALDDRLSNDSFYP